MERASSYDDSWRWREIKELQPLVLIGKGISSGLASPQNSNFSGSESLHPTSNLGRMQRTSAMPLQYATATYSGYGVKAFFWRTSVLILLMTSSLGESFRGNTDVINISFCKITNSFLPYQKYKPAIHKRYCKWYTQKRKHRIVSFALSVFIRSLNLHALSDCFRQGKMENNTLHY